MDIPAMKQQILASSDIDECKRSGAMPPLPRIRENSNFVFISYPHKDYQCVYCDLLELYEKGVKYWYDCGLTPGRSWEDEVKAKIRDPHCSGIVYYLSENSFTESMLFEIDCSKGGNTEEKPKNYFSVNLSGQNALKLLFRRGADSLTLTQEQIARILGIFPSDLTFVKRSTDPADGSHLSEMLFAIKERFNVTDGSNGEETRAKELLQQAAELKKQGRIAEALAIYEEICGIASASDRSLSQANLQLADHYFREETPSAKEKALMYVRSAAELGSTEALWQLADYYFKAGDYYLSARYRRKAAEGGHAPSQFTFALYCLSGSFGIPKDPSLALEFFRRAAEQGHEKAKTEYQRLCEQERLFGREDSSLSPEELSLKADFYFKSGDYSVSAQYRRKAAEAGCPEAQFSFADYCLSGSFGISKDPSLALEFFRRAAEQGHKKAKTEYQRLCEQEQLSHREDSSLSPEELSQKADFYFKAGDYHLSAQYRRKAAEGGHAPSQFTFADYCLSGSFGIPKDPSLALEFFRRAAEQGHKKATIEHEKLCEQLRLSHREDSSLSPEELSQKADFYFKAGDYSVSAQYRRKAAEAGHAPSQFTFADYCLSGSFGIPKDPSLALEFFRRAAEQGHEKAKIEYEKLKKLSSQL